MKLVITNCTVFPANQTKVLGHCLSELINGPHKGILKMFNPDEMDLLGAEGSNPRNPFKWDNTLLESSFYTLGIFLDPIFLFGVFSQSRIVCHFDHPGEHFVSSDPC